MVMWLSCPVESPDESVQVSINGASSTARYIFAVSAEMAMG